MIKTKFIETLLANSKDTALTQRDSAIIEYNHASVVLDSVISLCKMSHGAVASHESNEEKVRLYSEFINRILEFTEGRKMNMLAGVHQLDGKHSILEECLDQIQLEKEKEERVATRLENEEEVLGKDRDVGLRPEKLSDVRKYGNTQSSDDM